jgi:hypothetical protein
LLVATVAAVQAAVPPAAAGPAPKPSALPVSVGGLGDATLDTGAALRRQVVLTNQTDKPIAAELEFAVFQDPALYSLPAPDPVHGRDVAVGARSWSVLEGKVDRDGSMTDGKTWTDHGTPWNDKTKWSESFVYIDLGKVRRVTHLAWDSGDANWLWKGDFAAGADPNQCKPVAGLHGVDFYKKWGRQELDVPQPFEARYIRIRFHNDGQRVVTLKYPSEFHVYAGTADETWAFPAAGPTVAEGKLTREVPAKGEVTADIGDGRALAPGAYLLAVRTKAAGLTQLAYGHLFVMPPALPKGSVTREWRFGMNGADPKYAANLAREGNAWIRFENLKWPFVSPEPGAYRFDGSVEPWHVKLDEYFRTYKDAGLFTLPYLFLTPKYLQPAKPKGDGTTNPPTDLAKYAEFVFQTVARYGSKKHPAADLLTPDKLSGLGLIDTYELWNEANLDDPGWGAWKGPLSDYFVMFRHGAEAAKKADPAAKVAPCGWSGIDVPLMEQLRTFKYPDGKCPLDFTDMLSVHYYSFRIAPELATVNNNTHRDGSPDRGRTYEQDLAALAAWRDQYKPALPIWMTETGYDTGGPRGVDERLQACWLPRDVMMILAAGIDKVLVYREKGSNGNLFGCSGVLREDDSLKPAWFTYATLIRQLAGVSQSPLKVPMADENVRVYLWRSGAKGEAAGAGKPVLTVWAIQGTAKLPAKLGRCTITDAFGSSRTADVQQPLDLTEFPLYLTDFADPAALKALEDQGKAVAEAQRQRLEHISKLRAYLFDFGSMDRVGTMTLGVERAFTPVVATDMYDDTKAYGFETKGLTDQVEKWIHNPLTEDSVRVGPGAKFTFKAEAGQYVLKLCARPHADSKATLRGAEGGDLELKVPTGGDVVQAKVKVGTKPITLETGFYGALVWMGLIQEE